MILLTTLTGLLLLMVQLALYDFLLLCGEVRRELAVFSHPTKIYPDYVAWDATSLLLQEPSPAGPSPCKG